jgi:hypothetical protein
VELLFSPSEYSATIDFDDAAHHDCVNTRYTPLGIEFARDDGYCVHAYDWASLGRNTTSPPMVMATTSGPGAPTYVQHINLLFSENTYEVGAYIGNDQASMMLWTLEIFDINDQLIGSVQLVSNGNTHVDQYLGLTSPNPFWRARFSHDTSWLAVALDNVSFAGTAEGLSFYPVTPCRISDSRTYYAPWAVGQYRGPFSVGQTICYSNYGPSATISPQGGNQNGCPSPVGEPLGFHVIVTAVPVWGSGHVRLYPANVPRPNSSVLSWSADAGNISNGVSADSYYNGADEFCIYIGGPASGGSVHIGMDIMGYYYAAP